MHDWSLVIGGGWMKIIFVVQITFEEFVADVIRQKHFNLQGKGRQIVLLVKHNREIKLYS